MLFLFSLLRPIEVHKDVHLIQGVLGRGCQHFSDVATFLRKNDFSESDPPPLGVRAFGKKTAQVQLDRARELLRRAIPAAHALHAAARHRTRDLRIACMVCDSPLGCE